MGYRITGSVHYFFYFSLVYLHKTLLLNATTEKNAPSRSLIARRYREATSSLTSTFCLDWFVEYVFESCLRKFHSYVGEWLQNVRHCLALRRGWAGRDLYRAIPSITWNLCFHGFIQRSAIFSRLDNPGELGTYSKPDHPRALFPWWLVMALSYIKIEVCCLLDAR